jgi:hypothetical protein
VWLTNKAGGVYGFVTNMTSVVSNGMSTAGSSTGAVQVLTAGWHSIRWDISFEETAGAAAMRGTVLTNGVDSFIDGHADYAVTEHVYFGGTSIKWLPANCTLQLVMNYISGGGGGGGTVSNASLTVIALTGAVGPQGPQGVPGSTVLDWLTVASTTNVVGVSNMVVVLENMTNQFAKAAMTNSFALAGVTNGVFALVGVTNSFALAGVTNGVFALVGVTNSFVLHSMTNVLKTYAEGVTNNSILRTNTVTAAGAGIVIRQDGAGGISVSNTMAAASGENNVNGEISLTNATTFGLVYGKADVTNLLRSVSAGANMVITNQGTNLIFASTASGGGGAGSLPMNANQFITNGTVSIASGALVTNITSYDLSVDGFLYGNNMTTSRAAIWDVNGFLTNSAGVDTTELEYLDGVTGGIQTNIDARAVAGVTNSFALSGVTNSFALAGVTNGVFALVGVTNSYVLHSMTNVLKTYSEGVTNSTIMRLLDLQTSTNDAYTYARSTTNGLMAGTVASTNDAYAYARGVTNNSILRTNDTTWFMPPSANLTNWSGFATSYFAVAGMSNIYALATTSNLFQNRQIGAAVLSNLVSSSIDFPVANVVSNVSAVRFAVWTNYVPASSNFVFSFVTNRYDLRGQTNVIFTNLVEETAGVSADMAVHIYNTTAVTMGLVWPAYGAQHGYWFGTNANNPILSYTTLSAGGHGVASFTAFGTNIFATFSAWP